MGESQESLVSRGESMDLLDTPPEVALTGLEKKFLLCAERGDCASVRRMIEENVNTPKAEFDMNCVDPLNRSALISAIENENAELIHILLESGVQVKDALLHAIKEEYVEAVEILLEFEEENHKSGMPYSWEAVDRAQSSFTSDITPLVLAAHMNNYEILKILLDRGATLPAPHDVRCGCDDCVASSEHDSLRHSQARINAYRALSSPSLIALSSRDPLLTAFELSWELRRLSRMENEFRDEYNEMREQVQIFATSLLDHARNSSELDIILNYDPDGESTGERNTLERLKLAIKYKQKNFVAHPNVQQLLGSMWYDGLPGFRRKGIVAQLIEVAKMGSMFPVNSMVYVMAPNSETSKLMTKPFVKFICHSASYAFFLMMLGAASQRIEFLLLEWFGNDWIQELLADWKRRERGSLPGIVETGVIFYISSLLMWEMRSLWSDGLLEYISDLWNIVDFVSNMFYTTWIALRCTSIFISWREYWNGWDPYYPREQWDPFDPMLLSEGMFAAGMIFSFLKLVHIFSVNPHLGPLQISLGRMIIDIIKFFFIYTLVLFAFGCGMNQLLWYYADLDKKKCYHLPDGTADFENEDMACTIWRRFANLFETSQSLFWASFGMVDLMAFELTGVKSFTRFWALLMFGSYSVINVIVLLNMLIAMMSNSYQIISERSDTEWKFARSKLWMGYFEEGDVVPPPFNMMPSVEFLLTIIGKGKKPATGSVKVRSRAQARERHDTVARLLVRRYVTAEQCKRDDFGITEDDVMEIRQDISTLRYELVDILRNNGMKTPDLDPNDSGIHGKKAKTVERRLLKDFQIGFVEGVINDVLTADKEPKDVFSKIARAIGKRTSVQKKDWNEDAKRRDSRRDLIGSTTEMMERIQTRQSLRRYILDQNKEKQRLDPNKLVEYNPQLRDVSPAARVAYAKFKMRKIQEEFESEQEEEPSAKPSHQSVRLSRQATTALKRTLTANKDVVLQIEGNQPCTKSNGTKSVIKRSDGSETNKKPTKQSSINKSAPPVPADAVEKKDVETKKASIKSSAPDAAGEKDTVISMNSTANNPQCENVSKPKSIKKRESCISTQEPAASRSVSVKSKAPAAPPLDVRPESKLPSPKHSAFTPGKSTVSGKVLDGWI